MNGSPAKLGSIQGTSGHKSALKKLDEGVVKTKYGYSSTIESAPESAPKPKKKRSYAEAYKKRDLSIYGKDMSLADYTTEAKRQSASYEKTGKWDAPTKPMKTTPKVVKKDDGGFDASKYTVTDGTKTSGGPEKVETYGMKTEAEQNLAVRQAKRGRKVARKAAKKAKKIAKVTHGKDSAEFAEAKRLKKATKLQTRKRVLEAKKEDRRDDRGIFAGLRRGITKRRLKRVDKKIKKRGGAIDDPALSSRGKQESLIKDQPLAVQIQLTGNKEKKEE